MVPWVISSNFGTTHLFPTIAQVATGFVDLFNNGLIVHIGRSLMLCFQAISLSIVVSLLVVYISPIPVLAPLAKWISTFRFLPLVGITFYISLAISDARSMQVWVLIIFMSTYLVTSLMGVLADIKTEEYDHAMTLGCTRFESLIQVVILGRLDYVFDAVRQNLAIVWLMIVTVESILAAGGGIGFLIKNSDKFSNQGQLVALQLIILFIGVGLDFITNQTRKAVFRYSTFN
jgi:NitT/TauT family transport system permease protein